MREFVLGVRMLLRGFAWWREAPGVMARGLLPGVLAAVVLAGALGALIVFLGPLTEAVTPFAEAWPEGWAVALRVAIGIAVLGGSLVLSAVSFTALALLVGEPFYDRVWRSVERGVTGGVPDGGYGWAAAAGDAVLLLARGLGVALVTVLVGLVPVVGGVLATVVGVLATGWVLADELSSRALTARGLDRRTRRMLLRSHRARALGFGVATQLCFLVPLGAVLTMPAAVAGSTLLAQSLLVPAKP